MLRKSWILLTAIAPAVPALAVAPPPALPYWVNGTGAWQEADNAILVSPPSIFMYAGDTTPSILGQIYKNSVTESPGPAGNVVAQVGFGAFGSDPRFSTWTWLPATYNLQIGNNDQYTANFSINVPGTYAYTYRFSLDNGGTWTAADLAGTGSNPPIAFDPNDIGKLTVSDIALPEPAYIGILALGTTIGLRRRR